MPAWVTVTAVCHCLQQLPTRLADGSASVGQLPCLLHGAVLAPCTHDCSHSAAPAPAAPESRLSNLARSCPCSPTYASHAEVGYLLPFNLEALLTPFGALLDMLNNRRLCRCAAGAGALRCLWHERA